MFISVLASRLNRKSYSRKTFRSWATFVKLSLWEFFFFFLKRKLENEKVEAGGMRQTKRRAKLVDQKRTLFLPRSLCSSEFLLFNQMQFAAV